MMHTVMRRSFAENMGLEWPKEIAMLVDGKPVTFAELKAARVKEQRRRWELRQTWEPSTERRAAFVWTFYQPGLFGFAYAGWHLYIRTLSQDWGLGGRPAMTGLTHLDIMQQFPCGLLPIAENFQRWKQVFAREHSRPGRFRKQGLLPGWVITDGVRPLKFEHSNR